MVVEMPTFLLRRMHDFNLMGLCKCGLMQRIVLNCGNYTGLLYRTIYQQYFADEGCDFMISYGANGNSRVILNENEEIIEYLVYDRLSENEKCELYVLYRSKKNADGSWHISEAEILDIFAYNVSTKDVVSSGKTSWSATGSEEHEIN